MCAIAGIWDIKTLSIDDLDKVQKMNRIQVHRGPDDEGLYRDTHCILGHRRLSIIDLTSGGHQPFVSKDNRYAMVFNGEIYNYIELREELTQLGRSFVSESDTEVLLQAYEQWGSQCLSKLNGMFAFAVYDTLDKTIFLARDRLGIKPLYYVSIDSKVYFASEIKALISVLDIPLSVNYQSILDFWMFNRTDINETTFLNEIKRLPKGCYLSNNQNAFAVKKWWDANRYMDEKNIPLEQACHCIHELMVSSVHLRMRSDVEVGSCLSGGLDSSILAGIIAKKIPDQDKFSTFTAVFPGSPIDESKYVNNFVEILGFKNYQTSPRANQALSDLEKFIWHIEEPIPAPSFYAQYDVMRLIHEKGIKVVLDGQGADEIFAGYQYFHGYYLNELLKKRHWLRFGSDLAHTILRNQHRSFLEMLIYLQLPKSMRKKSLLRQSNFLDKDFANHYCDQSLIFSNFFGANSMNQSLLNHLEYKLEHLLRIEDRTSMAHSVEARVPYLDHRLVECLLGVAGQLKIKQGQTKYLQKQALHQYTSEEILQRKDKIGFDVPTNDWMSSPEWKNHIHECLDEIKFEFPKMFGSKENFSWKSKDCWKLAQVVGWNRMVKSVVKNRATFQRAVPK